MFLGSIGMEGVAMRGYWFRPVFCFGGTVEWVEQLERFAEHMRYSVAVLVLIKEENNADKCIHYLL